MQKTRERIFDAFRNVKTFAANWKKERGLLALGDRTGRTSSRNFAKQGRAMTSLC
jgi:hypothetical protein